MRAWAVGSGQACDDDVWRFGVRGPHGVGAWNEAGTFLLEFLAQLDLTVCNTLFEKKNIHKWTWQHPR